eukprot:m.279327 g.279327  ORF g.279327 m.279327 type:complete len:295 (+) comp19388_c0_seq2:5215-6099(+)
MANATHAAAAAATTTSALWTEQVVGPLSEVGKQLPAWLPGVSVDDGQGAAFYAVGLFLVASVPYFLLGGFYFALDALQLLQGRRLTPEPKGSPRSLADMLKCLAHTATMHIAVLVPYLFLAVVPALRSRGLSWEAPLPAWTEVAWHVLVSALINDTIFYWAHRIVHSPSLYRMIHKQHHKYKAPFAWASEYAGVFELLAIDGTPIFVGPYLLRSHVFSLYVWMFIRLVYTLEIHSGFDLWVWRLIPFYGGAPMHEWHHNNTLGNYSDCFSIWDRLCGTYFEPPPLGSKKKVRSD